MFLFFVVGEQIKQATCFSSANNDTDQYLRWNRGGIRERSWGDCLRLLAYSVLLESVLSQYNISSHRNKKYPAGPPKHHKYLRGKKG